MAAFTLIAATMMASMSFASAKYLTNEEIIHLYGRKIHTGPIQLRTPKNVNETLRQAAAGKGLFMGSEICLGCLQNSSDTLYNSTAAAQYNLLTAENECKWSETEPGNGQFDLGQCTAIAQFAKAAGMVHRLHNLDWGVDNVRIFCC